MNHDSYLSDFDPDDIDHMKSSPHFPRLRSMPEFWPEFEDPFLRAFLNGVIEDEEEPIDE